MKIYQDYEETDWSIIWREYEESRKSSHWEQLELDIQNKSSEELLLRIKWLNKLIVEKQNGIEYQKNELKENTELKENNIEEFIKKWGQLSHLPLGFLERMIRENEQILHLLLKELKLCDDTL